MSGSDKVGARKDVSTPGLAPKEQSVFIVVKRPLDPSCDWAFIHLEDELRDPSCNCLTI